MSKMITRKDLIKEVANRTGYNQTDIKAVLDNVDGVITDAVANQETVKLFAGVTVEGRYVEAHTARNPRTGESVDVPAKIVPKVKVTNKAFKS